MPFNDFFSMFKYYMRRNIFNQHDYQMLMKEVVYDNDSFLEKIVRPKMFQGRLNYGDFLRIVATIL